MSAYVHAVNKCISECIYILCNNYTIGLIYTYIIPLECIYYTDNCGIDNVCHR